MKKEKLIKDSSFAVYGLGLSGKSVLRFLKRKKIKKIYSWDDNKRKNNKKNFYLFKKKLDEVDYIVISPGINIQKTKFKSTLFRNKKKIITDLDLFYMQKIPIKSIVTLSLFISMCLFFRVDTPYELFCFKYSSFPTLKSQSIINFNIIATCLGFSFGSNLRFLLISVEILLYCNPNKYKL